jgi:hypothetical protein
MTGTGIAAAAEFSGTDRPIGRQSRFPVNELDSALVFVRNLRKVFYAMA